MEQGQIQAQARAKQAHVLTVPGQREAVLTDAQGYQRSKPDAVVMDSLHTQTTPGKQAQTLHLYQTTVANTKNAAFNSGTAWKQNTGSGVETKHIVESYEAQLQSNQMDWEDTVYYQVAPLPTYDHPLKPNLSDRFYNFRKAQWEWFPDEYVDAFIVGVEGGSQIILDPWGTVVGIYNGLEWLGNSTHDLIVDSASAGIIKLAGKSLPEDVSYRFSQRAARAENLYYTVIDASGPDYIRWASEGLTGYLLTAGIGYTPGTVVRASQVHYADYVFQRQVKADLSNPNVTYQVNTRANKMIDDNIGYNISSRQTLLDYDQIGAEYTYVTDYQAISSAIGTVSPNKFYNVGYSKKPGQVNYYQARMLQLQLGLKDSNNIYQGFGFTQIDDLVSYNPFKPMGVNPYNSKFDARGLPAGGPELVLAPIPTTFVLGRLNYGY